MTLSPAGQSAAARIDVRLLLFLVLSTLLVAFGVQGYENGVVNNFRDQSIQLPIIDSYTHPDLFAGDFLLEARRSYVTWFYPALGQLSRVIARDTLMLVLYVLAVGLTVGAIYALAEGLFPRRRVGLIAVILWMAYFPNPGGDFIHSPFVTHTTFAVALELWALALIFRQRRAAAALLLGVAANVNAMTSFFVAFAWMVALLSDRKAWSWRLAYLPVLMGMMAFPVLGWRSGLPLVESSLDEFVAIIRLRLWYAVFTFSISGLLSALFAALLVLWVYSFRYGRTSPPAEILRMAGGIAILSVIGTVFTEVYPVEFVIELQLIRGTGLILLFILLYLAHLIRCWLDRGRLRETLLAGGLVMAFAAVRWIIEWHPPSQPTPYPLAVDLDTPWEAALRPFTALLLILLGVLVWSMSRRAPGQRRLALWAVFSLGCLTLPAFLNSGIPSSQRITTVAWEDVLGWIERHTPEEALFITPPTLDGFRTRARRAQVGDWKDGTVGIFHNGWAVEWRQRMIDLGFSEETFSFEPLTTGQLCEAAARYHATYALVFREWEVEGTPVYENDLFAVLPVNSLPCS